MSKWWKQVLLGGLWYLFPLVSTGFCFFQCGKVEGAHEQRAKHQCSCGQKRTCAFGVGIVGEQSCQEDRWDGNKWSRCEPKLEPALP